MLHLLEESVLRAHYWESKLERCYVKERVERNKPGTWQDSNPQHFDHEACPLPLCFNHGPIIKKIIIRHLLLQPWPIHQQRHSCIKQVRQTLLESQQGLFFLPSVFSSAEAIDRFFLPAGPIIHRLIIVSAWAEGVNHQLKFPTHVWRLSMLFDFRPPRKGKFMPNWFWNLIVSWNIR